MRRRGRGKETFERIQKHNEICRNHITLFEKDFRRKFSEGDIVTAIDRVFSSAYIVNNADTNILVGLVLVELTAPVMKKFSKQKNQDYLQQARSFIATWMEKNFKKNFIGIFKVKTKTTKRQYTEKFALFGSFLD